MNKNYFEFLSKMQLRYVTNYLLIILLFILMMIPFWILPTVIKGINMSVAYGFELAFLFVIGGIAAIISVRLFKTNLDDGTELLILSKPISRSQIIVTKTVVFFIPWLFIAIIGMIIIGISLGIPDNEMWIGVTDKALFVPGFLIGSFLIWIIFGFGTLLVALIFGKIAGIIFGFFLPVILLIVAIIIPMIFAFSHSYYDTSYSNGNSDTTLMDVLDKDGNAHSISETALYQDSNKTEQQLWDNSLDVINKNNNYAILNNSLDFGLQFMNILSLTTEKRIQQTNEEDNMFVISGYSFNNVRKTEMKDYSKTYMDYYTGDKPYQKTVVLDYNVPNELVTYNRDATIKNVASQAFNPTQWQAFANLVEVIDKNRPVTPTREYYQTTVLNELAKGVVRDFGYNLSDDQMVGMVSTLYDEITYNLYTQSSWPNSLSNLKSYPSYDYVLSNWMIDDDFGNDNSSFTSPLTQESLEINPTVSIHELDSGDMYIEGELQNNVKTNIYVAIYCLLSIVLMASTLYVFSRKDFA